MAKGQANALPNGLTLAFDETPAAELRATLAREINDFHSRTVPHEAQRFAFRVCDDQSALQGAVIGVLSWDWLFIEALWVSDALRGQGVGRQLMAQAEARAVAHGCHSAWLDTFQAKAFYESIGYELFGQLDNFPAGQTRSFMRRRLA
jgi:ribosomal protein S18 acetylase RimI-like enzyme